jgi:hypothetical protein
MKYIRMNSTIDGYEQEKALYALAAAADEFASRHHRRPVFKDKSDPIFAGLDPRAINRVYDYLELDDPLFITFLEGHLEQFRPLKVCNAHQVVRLPKQPNPDYPAGN